MISKGVLQANEQSFQGLLDRHGFKQEIVWTFYEDYIWDGHILYVQRQCIQMRDLAHFVQDCDLDMSFGLELRLVAVCDGLSMCSMFVPNSSEIAESMMIVGIKLMLPSKLPMCVNVVDELIWAGLLSQHQKQEISFSPIGDLVRKSR
jgi:hypothetical protein